MDVSLTIGQPGRRRGDAPATTRGARSGVPAGSPPGLGAEHGRSGSQIGQSRGRSRRKGGVDQACGKPPCRRQEPHCQGRPLLQHHPAREKASDASDPRWLAVEAARENRGADVPGERLAGRDEALPGRTQLVRAGVSRAAVSARPGPAGGSGRFPETHAAACRAQPGGPADPPGPVSRPWPDRVEPASPAPAFAPLEAAPCEGLPAAGGGARSGPWPPGGSGPDDARLPPLPPGTAASRAPPGSRRTGASAVSGTSRSRSCMNRSAGSGQRPSIRRMAPFSATGTMPKPFSCAATCSSWHRSAALRCVAAACIADR